MILYRVSLTCVGFPELTRICLNLIYRHSDNRGRRQTVQISLLEILECLDDIETSLDDRERKLSEIFLAELQDIEGLPVDDVTAR